MQNFPEIKLNESSLGLQVAFRASLITCAFSTILFFLEKNMGISIGHGFEVILRIIIVGVAISFLGSRINRFKELETSDSFLILSTIFFYGITVLLLSLGQAGYIIGRAIFSESNSAGSTLLFFLGIKGFDISTLFFGFITSHIPYVAYYFFLSAKIKKIT